MEFVAAKSAFPLQEYRRQAEESALMQITVGRKASANADRKLLDESCGPRIFISTVTLP